MPSRPGSTSTTASARRAGPRPVPDEPGAVPPGEHLVVGAVPLSARAVGLLLAPAGLAGAASAFPTYLVVGGDALVQATGPASVLLAMLQPGVFLAVGLVLLRGKIPKFGLAYATVSGALAAGLLLIELYRGSGGTGRPGTEVLAGRQVLTSTVEVGAGWVLGVVALALVVLAGLVAIPAWGRTVMDDAGRLDPARPALAGAGAMLGVLAVLSLVLPAADVPDPVVIDPVTGLRTVVAADGPQALLERPGLALLGGLLLAGAVLLCSVMAPSLRPRPATVGGLLAIAVPLLVAGLTGLRDALLSAELEWTVPGAGLLLAGAGYAGLTVLAWRLRRSDPPQE